MQIKTSCYVQGALLTDVGVLLPLVFHVFGQDAGRLFLPMHLPTLMAGLMLGPLLGCIVGILTPILSYLFMGMPPIPVLFFMIAELAVYGMSSGFFLKKLGLNIYICLILSMILGRIASGITVLFAVLAFSFGAAPLPYVTGAVVAGIPGIIAQIVILPPLYAALKKGGYRDGTAANGH